VGLTSGGIMKKSIALFLFVAFATPVFSAELICAPDFEVVGLNADFAKSSIRVLQGKMETRGSSRQLLIPSATDSVNVTDNENHQMNWAKNKGCSYLLQTTLTRLGETVQVNMRLMDLNSNNYIFKRAYKADSPDDLHPILSQAGSSLQDTKFAAVETIYDVTNADAKSLTKKKSSTYYSLSVNGAYFKDFEDLYGIGVGYFFDGRTFMGELVLNLGFGSNDNSVLEAGLRVFYPFSDKNSTFYIGGGAGYAATSKTVETKSSYNDYTYNDIENSASVLVECSVGYLVGRTNNFLFRIEANASSLINEKSAGGGLRIILGIGD
jgi:hypothetical protein